MHVVDARMGIRSNISHNGRHWINFVMKSDSNASTGLETDDCMWVITINRSKLFCHQESLSIHTINAKCTCIRNVHNKEALVL